MRSTIFCQGVNNSSRVPRGHCIALLSKVGFTLARQKLAKESRLTGMMAAVLVRALYSESTRLDRIITGIL